MDDWKSYLVEDEGALRGLLRGLRRVAVLGIKTEAQRDQPAFYVPAYLADAGLEVVPVPVYYPEVREILGRPVYRSLAAIPGEIDLVDVFRRAEHTPDVARQAVQIGAKVLWLQLGIVNEEARRIAEAAGLSVIMDACLMIEHDRLRL